MMGRAGAVYLLLTTMSFSLMSVQPQRTSKPHALARRQYRLNGEVVLTDFGALEAILPQSGRIHHASQLMVYHRGGDPQAWRLLCAWSSKGKSGSSAIAVSRLDRGSDRWTVPTPAVVQDGHTLQNPAWLWDSSSDVISLMYSASRWGAGQVRSSRPDTFTDTWVLHVLRGTAWQAGAFLRVCKSRDGGRSFEASELLIPTPGAFLRNHPLKGMGQEWLLPMYYTPQGLSHYQSQWSQLRWSSDLGSTWSAGVPMSQPGAGLVQPSIIRLQGADNASAYRLVAFFRSRYMDNIWRAESTDEGRSWSEPRRTALPQNNKAIQAIALASGNVAMVFNNNRASGSGKTLMHPLSIALSLDGGDSWPYVRDLEPDYPAGLDFTYPSLVQTQDGAIHISHTWSGLRSREGIRYCQISEEWIKGSYDWGSTSGLYQPR